MNSSLLRVLQIYWHKVLSLPGRGLFLLQLALLSIRLLIASQPLPEWFVESQSSSLSLRKAVVEALLLLLFQAQWCAWSEQLYSLRRTFQPSETLHSRPWRRFALHVYGGFIFLFVLSGLAAIQPLLGIGAMFLLFISAEAQDRRLGNQSIAMALPLAMVRSYRLISHEPWRFLGNLFLPGVVLYGGGVLLVWMRQQGELILPRVLQVMLIGLMLALWLVFFQLAQLRIGLRAEAELDVDVLMGLESDHQPKPVSPLLLTMKACLQRFEWLCQGLAVLFGLLCGGWLLLRLADSSLLSSHALMLAFSSMLSILSGTVATFFTLLVRLVFVAIVSAVLVILVMLVIGVGRRDPWKPIQLLSASLQRRLESLAQLFSHLNLAKGATLGLGTLLTVLGTVAVQTYDRVQKDQAQQSTNRQNLQRQLIVDSEQDKARMQRNDALVERIQQRVIEFRKGPSEAARVQLLTELRDVLPKLTTADGMVDGARKGRLLRYLYESDLLSAPSLLLKVEMKNKQDNDKAKDCLKRIGAPGRRGQPAKDVAKDLKGCTSTLFLHAMDFSGASLENAYLRGAFLPYLDLRYANLRKADLTNTILRSANLENADFSGANLTGTDLDSTILVGANLNDVNISDQNWPNLNGAEAFYASYSFPDSVNSDAAKRLVHVMQSMVSWDLVKADKPFDTSLDWQDMKQFLWTFCPLDPANDLRLGALNMLPPKTKDQRIEQAGSKCNNRRFGMGQKEEGALSFADRDWSGSSFRGSTLKGVTLNRIRLDGADFSDSTFDDVTLKDVSFAGANLKGAVFRDSNLDDVDFSGAELQGMRFESLQRLYNPRYRGSVVDFDKNSSFSSYRKNLIRSHVYNGKVFDKLDSDEVAVFRRSVVLPLLIPPLSFRPQHLLYWMLAYPLPASLASNAFDQP